MMENQQTLSCVKMAKRDISKELMNLAMEIICLLTGENCVVVTKTSVEDNPEITREPESARVKERQGPVAVHPLPFMTLEGQTKKKILEVSQKITELMTEEVPIMCQDVLLKEWRCKDVIMEGQQKVTSHDGSRKRNPRPRDSTQEDLAIPHQDQGEEMIMVKVKIKEEEEDETYVRDDPSVVTIKVEESDLDISTDGSSKRNPPQRCPRPLDSWDSTQEDHTDPHQDQGEEMIYTKGEVKEEETNTSVYYSSMEEVGMVIQTNLEGCSLDISTDGRRVKNSLESQSFVSSYVKDDNRGQNLQEVSSDLQYKFPETYNLEKSRDPSNSENSLLNHGGNHTERGKAFTKRRQRDKHQKRDKSKQHSCPECGKSFNEKGHFQRHMRIHTSKNPYSCSDCGKCFTQKEYLVRHQKIHTGEYPFSCSECGKCFSQKAYLVRHQRTHTNVRPYICTDCGKCYVVKSLLLKHQKIHSGERPYSCKECGKSFFHKGNLHTHQKTHSGDRPYVCSECGKRFLYKTYLISHIRVHTGERPFTCTECGKSFAAKAKLVKHHIIHTGVSAFSCSECGKCFTQKPDLEKHQRIHTGERPFSCPECGKSFTQKSGLLQHQKIHTREGPFSCTECGIRFSQKQKLIEHQSTHVC